LSSFSDVRFPDGTSFANVPGGSEDGFGTAVELKIVKALVRKAGEPKK
jgi:hypothetical protein